MPNMCGHAVLCMNLCECRELWGEEDRAHQCVCGGVRRVDIIVGVCGRCLAAAAHPPQRIQDLGLAARQLLAVR